MPNWVSNTLTFKNQQDCARVRDLMEVEGSGFDFNKLIPEPASLEVESSSRGNMAVAYYLSDRGANPDVEVDAKYLTWLNPETSGFALVQQALDYIGDDAEAADKIYDLGKAYVDNVDQYGSANWYEWRNKNWGVKWPASEVYWSDDSVSFDTPWDPPYPVLEKLAHEMDISFDVHSYVEGNGVYDFDVTPEGIGSVKMTSLYDFEDDDPELDEMGRNVETVDEVEAPAFPTNQDELVIALAQGAALVHKPSNKVLMVDGVGMWDADGDLTNPSGQSHWVQGSPAVFDLETAEYVRPMAQGAYRTTLEAIERGEIEMMPIDDIGEFASKAVVSADAAYDPETGEPCVKSAPAKQESAEHTSPAQEESIAAPESNSNRKERLFIGNIAPKHVRETKGTSLSVAIPLDCAEGGWANVYVKPWEVGDDKYHSGKKTIGLEKGRAYDVDAYMGADAIAHAGDAYKQDLREPDDKGVRRVRLSMDASEIKQRSIAQVEARIAEIQARQDVEPGNEVEDGLDFGE